jgi:hypothetical protein
MSKGDIKLGLLIWCYYRPARLHRLSNRFLWSLKVTVSEPNFVNDKEPRNRTLEWSHGLINFYKFGLKNLQLGEQKEKERKLEKGSNFETRVRR